MSIFSKTKVRKPQKSSFDLSHENLITTNFGTLTPVLCKEVLPGDVMRCRSEVLVKLAPLIAPIMHRVDCFTHYFFVPNRLVWSGWEEFITGGPDGQSVIQPPFFQIGEGGEVLLSTIKSYNWYRLLDSLGVNFPSYGDADRVPLMKFSQLPFRAYQLIYNEFYRDQNLMDPVDIQKDSSGVHLLSGGLTLLVSCYCLASVLTIRIIFPVPCRGLREVCRQLCLLQVLLRFLLR